VLLREMVVVVDRLRGSPLGTYTPCRTTPLPTPYCASHWSRDAVVPPLPPLPPQAASSDATIICNDKGAHALQIARSGTLMRGPRRGRADSPECALA
jgi:hypothetical protein